MEGKVININYMRQMTTDYGFIKKYYEVYLKCRHDKYYAEMLECADEIKNIIKTMLKNPCLQRDDKIFLRRIIMNINNDLETILEN